MAVNDGESEGLHLPAFMPLHQISLLEGHSRGHLSTGVPPSRQTSTQKRAINKKWGETWLDLAKNRDGFRVSWNGQHEHLLGDAFIGIDLHH